MKTIERVFEILNKEKVELKAEKVELGALNDMKNIANILKKNYEKQYSELRDLKNATKQIRTKFVKITQEAAGVPKLYFDTKKKIEELGVKMPKDFVKNYKEAIEFQKKANDIVGELGRIDAMIQSL